MNVTNKILAMMLILILIPFTVFGAAQDDGRTYFTVKAFCANTDNAVTNEYATGQISVSLTDGLYVKSEDYYDDGAYFEYALSAGWIESNITGLLTVVTVDLPITGTGAIGDPLDIDSSIAGYGLSMTTDIIDVNTGSGIYIDGSDSVAVGWNDRAGHTLDFDVATLAADTTLEWPDIVDGGFLQVATGGAMSWDTSPLTGCCSLDETYDASTSTEKRIVADDGSVVILGSEVIYTSAIGSLFEVFDSSANNILYVGPEEVVVNSDQKSGGDLIWRSISHNFALIGDASANCVSIVPTEYLGDVDTQGHMYYSNGGGEYYHVYYPDAGARTDGGLAWPTDTPVAGESLIVTSVDGSNVVTSEWSAATLDAAYDAGNTIDYTGASGAGDAVILSVATAEDPDYFLTMLHDELAAYTFATEADNNIFRIFDETGNATHFFGGMNGNVTLNSNQESTGDLVWKSLNYSGAITADASADVLTVVIPEYLGTADTQGYLYFEDGDGEYALVTAEDVTTSYELRLPAIAGTAGQVPYVSSAAANQSQLGFTNNYRTPYAWGTEEQIQAMAGTELKSNFITVLPIAQAGTITRIECYVHTWAVMNATDTLTVTLSYGTLGALSTTTSTSTTGATCTFGTDKSLAVTQGQVLSVKAAVSADDIVAGMTVVVTVDGVS